MSEPESSPLSHLRAGAVAMLGVRWDRMSSHLRGAADAPPAIRKALFSGSSNLTAEDGTDLAHPDTNFVDAGDVTVDDRVEPAAAMAAIGHAVDDVLDRGAKVLALGGDHAVTVPVVRAHVRRHGPVEILHFDAHPDLYDEYDGDRFSHACPFARIMEEGLARRLVQVGIRTMNRHQREQAERFGVEVIDMASVERAFELRFSGPVYVSLDVDGLDPAFAPGVSHREPGGLATRDVLRILQRVDAPVAGADIVEYNPSRDVSDLTAMVCAKLVKELASLLTASRARS